MGCASCGTGACTTTPNGCNNNGGCATGGCNKLNTFDWFGNMLNPNEDETQNIYEVRFKNTRKRFFRNINGLNLVTGDIIAVESDRGFDVGVISLGGVLARLQMKKRRIDPNSEKVRKIYRIATEEDTESLKKARSREMSALIRCREIVRDLDLDMKMSDIEFQGDNSKAIFFYIADQRVDFRRLIKVLAEEFRIRVEMKQIGLRHEAGLVGGIGSCGRELCCSTWLTDFKTVSTSAARYQNLSLNPMKISGQCGRLKCCLNYELEVYLDAIKGIPKIDRIETEMGIGLLQKTDIFKGTMWFCYESENTWIPIELAMVRKMVEMNEQGKKPVSLHAITQADVAAAKSAEIDFVDVVGQAVLRPDPKRGKRKGKGRGRGPQNRQGGGGQQNQNRQGRNQGQGNKQNRDSEGKNQNQNRNQEGRNKNQNRNKGKGGQNPNQKPNRNKNQNRNKPSGDKGRGPQGNKGDGNQNKPDNPKKD